MNEHPTDHASGSTLGPGTPDDEALYEKLYQRVLRMSVKLGHLHENTLALNARPGELVIPAAIVSRIEKLRAQVAEMMTDINDKRGVRELKERWGKITDDIDACALQVSMIAQAAVKKAQIAHALRTICSYIEQSKERSA